MTGTESGGDMGGDADTATRTRPPLSPDRVVRAAVDVADADGLDAVTMRRVADALDVEAMSLYHHVANKEALLDGMVEYVIAEVIEVAGIDVPTDLDDWQAAVRTRILAARSVMLAHKWAPAVIATRTGMSATTMSYYDSLLGLLVEGGFTWDLAHHAMHAIGSRALGFSPELFEPDDPGPEHEAAAAAVFEAATDRLPYLVGMTAAVAHDDPESTIGWCDDQVEFEFSLDIILEGLERRRTTS